jgi:hypothetical protein
VVEPPYKIYMGEDKYESKLQKNKTKKFPSQIINNLRRTFDQICLARGYLVPREQALFCPRLFKITKGRLLSQHLLVRDKPLKVE